jgi:predicted ferric reductase
MAGMMLATTSKTVWYLSRASGVVSLVLLTLSVFLGILTSSRWATARWPRFVTEGLHRNVSLAVNAFLALHVVTIVMDEFALTGWLQIFLPFGGGYRPLWVAMGALALDILIVVIVTSLLRPRIPVATWRLIHWLSYGCWPLAVLHGWGSGTDRARLWMAAIDAVCIGAVLVALWFRVLSGLRLAGEGKPLGVYTRPDAVAQRSKSAP